MENGDADGDQQRLHIALIPWLAVGHLLPFAEFAARLARRGHHVSLLSTPRNLARLPTGPPSLHLVPLAFPSVGGLPASAEATSDLTSPEQLPRLRRAFDQLHTQLHSFLELRRPDWIVIDYAAHWAPAVAAHFNIPCAFLSLFNAACLSFFGPTSVMLAAGEQRTTVDDLVRVPPWVPFPTTVAFRKFEARRILGYVAPSPSEGDNADDGDSFRFAKAIDSCQVIAVRSNDDLEKEWLQLLRELHGKQVLPVGLFPPLQRQEAASSGGVVERFLDMQERRTVVYAAFGTEAKLSAEEARAVAAGLEISGMPFVLVLRGLPAALPEGFEDRIKGRGVVVTTGWVPQMEILRHGAVSVFLTHCGWNSLVEGMSLGLKLVLLPMIFDQGYNARLLVEKGIGVEVPREEETGAFTAEDVAATLKRVISDEEADRRARETGMKYGDEDANGHFIDGFLHFLKQNRANH